MLIKEKQRRKEMWARHSKFVSFVIEFVKRGMKSDRRRVGVNSSSRLPKL